MTDDSGATWRTIVNGLPRDQYVHVVREDPQNPDVLYAGLEQGVWYSLDRGAHWQSLRLNMPAVAVHDMRIQPQRHDLWSRRTGGAFGFSTMSARFRACKVVAVAAPRSFRCKRLHLVSLVDAYYGTHPDECCLAPDVLRRKSADGAAITTIFRRASAPGSRSSTPRPARPLLRRADDAGVERTAWDLTETAPVPWLRAREWNRGGAGPPSSRGVIPSCCTLEPRRRRDAGSPSRSAGILDTSAIPRALSVREGVGRRAERDRRCAQPDGCVAGTLSPFDSAAGDKVYSMFTSGVVNSKTISSRRTVCASA